MIASFSNKTFVVSQKKIYTIGDISLSSSIKTEEIEVTGSKPSTYIKGKDLNKLNFTLSLDGRFVDVRKEIDDWDAILDAGKPYPFILGDKPIGKNKYLLKEAAKVMTEVDNKGRIHKASLALSFEEYVKAGSPASNTEGAGSAGSIISKTASGSVRNNPNATAAKANGNQSKPGIALAPWPSSTIQKNKTNYQVGNIPSSFECMAWQNGNRVNTIFQLDFSSKPPLKTWTCRVKAANYNPLKPSGTVIGTYSGMQIINGKYWDGNTSIPAFNSNTTFNGWNK